MMPCRRAQPSSTASGTTPEMAERDPMLGRSKAWLTRGVEALEDLSGGERGQGLACRPLEVELALLDELHGRGGRDGLGHGGDPGDGVERHRRVLAQLPLTKRPL